jgi:hypothetical protein
MTTEGLGEYVRGQTDPAFNAVGGFFSLCVETGKALPRPPFSGANCFSRPGSS